MPSGIIEVNTLVGMGQQDFYDTVDFDFGPTPNDELFIIQDVHKWIDIYDLTVIRGNKVIYNGYLWKNIIYKTAENTKVGKDRSVVVKGDVKQQTIRKRIEGVIDITPEMGMFIDPQKDKAILLCAFVLGEYEEKLEPRKLQASQMGYKPEEQKQETRYLKQNQQGAACSNPAPQPVPIIDPPDIESYKKLHEKICYRIRIKVVRDQLLDIDYNSVVDDGCCFS